MVSTHSPVAVPSNPLGRILATLFVAAVACCNVIAAAQQTPADPRPLTGLNQYISGKGTVALAQIGSIVDDSAARRDATRFQASYFVLLKLLALHQQAERLRERIDFGRRQLDQWLQKTDQGPGVLSAVNAFEVVCLVLERRYAAAEGLARSYLGEQKVFQLARTEENKEVLLSFAQMLAAQGRHQEAASVLYQALVIASFQAERIGFFAVTDLCRIADGYLSNHQPQIAALILDKAIPLIDRQTGPNAHLIGCYLVVLDITLIAERVDIAEKIEKLIADQLPHVDLLSWETRLRLAAAQVYLHTKLRNFDVVRQRLVEFEAQLKPPIPDFVQRYGFSIAAWARFSIGETATAEDMLKSANIGTSIDDVHAVALLTAAEILEQKGRGTEALMAASGAYGKFSQGFLSRLQGAKGERTTLPVSEREITKRFVELGVRRVHLDHADDPIWRTLDSQMPVARELFAAMQLLNADSIPRLAALSASLNLVQQPDFKEQLRAREHIALRKLESYEVLAEKVVKRELDTGVLVQPDYAELNRFFEYQHRLAALDTVIEARSKKYFFSSRLGIFSPDDARQQLGAGEALLLYTRLNTGYSIACVTRELTIFAETPERIEDIDRNIRNLRASLQTEIEGRIQDDLSYPASDAFKLYQALLAPAYKCIAEKKDLLLVLPHELLTVPFNALLTDPVTVENEIQLRKAPWTIRRWSFSVAPSIEVLMTARSASSESYKRKAFLGIGDPVLGDAGQTVATSNAEPSTLFMSRGLGNVGELRKLPSLPETKAEIEFLASKFSKAGATTLLRNAATEKQLRGIDLRTYRIVSFATHALVAGEFGARSEPALVLTPVDDLDPANDGLLTATEISLLALDADVVVLSACNTATPSGSPDAKGLSGLIAAFLFSGARSVLASQWPVLSFAATDLITKAFALSESGTPLSEALRIAMLASINNSVSPFESHPRVWAPFVLIGNGALITTAAAPVGPHAQELEVVWEANLADRAAGEVMSVAPLGNGEVWFSGIGEPSTTRVSSFIERRTSSGDVVARRYSAEISWGQLIAMPDGGVLVAGQTFSERNKSAANLTRLDAQGQERWSIRVDSARFDDAVGLLADDQGSIWVVSQANLDHAVADPETVLIIFVDDAGNVKRRLELQIPKASVQVRPSSVVKLGNTLLLAGWASGIGSHRMDRDLLTGFTYVCDGATWLTYLYEIDIESGSIRRTSQISNFWGLRLRQSADGRTLLAGGMVEPCTNLVTTAAVLEVNADLKAERLVFHYGQGLRGRAIDVITDRQAGMAVVGLIETSFDVPPFKRFDLNKPYEGQPFGDLNRDRHLTLSAFVVVRRATKGKYAARIFSDLRGRSFNTAAFSDDGDIFIGGTANGSSAWIGRFLGAID